MDSELKMVGQEPRGKKTAGASSSRKVLQLLFAFSERRREASVPELAKIIDTPVPTVYRYVALLKEMQLIEEGKTGIYHPTANIMPLARAAQLSNNLAGISKPVLDEAARNLRETIMLFQYFDNSAVCVERAECDRRMRFTFEPGHSLPLGEGASGKMLLAALTDRMRTAKVAELDGTGALQLAIVKVIADGYATSRSEVDEGVWACSVPVLTNIARPAVLTLAGPAARISSGAKRSTIESLHSYADTIRAEFERFVL